MTPARLSALAALVALLAGCGGDGSGAPTTVADTAETTESTETVAETTEPVETTEPAETTETETLTREELVERMDRFCRRANAEARDRFAARMAAAGEAGDYEALADLFERRTALFRRQSERAPVQPDDLAPADARPFRRYLALSARMREVELEFAAALRTRSDAEIQAAGERLERTARQRSRPAATLGLSECGRPP